MKKRALISVYDKKGILDFASRLSSLGYEILSTGGTLSYLSDGGVSCVSVSEITKFPECLDGRVKTLHPKIHAGILADRSLDSHMRQLENLGVGTIDIVCVNLYPFEKTIASESHTIEDAIENIDIGGPAMIRSAAKNCASVAVLTDPSDYNSVIAEIENGGLSLEAKRALAAKAFRLTALYDSIISRYFAEGPFTESVSIGLRLAYPLRYGENPTQEAAFYTDPMDPAKGVSSAEILWGKQLSYNNIADANAAIEILMEFWPDPTAVAVKHESPCCIASSENIAEAYEKAREADPVSIFGGIVALNQKVDEKTASLLSETFLEIVIAPAFEEGALAILEEKKNLRILKAPFLEHEAAKKGVYVKKVLGGALLSTYDEELFTALETPTASKATEDQMRDLGFALKAVKHIKSNAIALAKDRTLIGAGGGQTSRISALEIALKQAGGKAEGACLASDAFFPFSDCVKLAAGAGIAAIIQPGGSNNDEESIKAADEANIPMVISGLRHFKH